MDAAHDFRQPLGQLLVEEGILSSDQLEAALRAQYGTDKQLGQVLIELGYVAPGAIEAALVDQQTPAPDGPALAPDLLAAWREAVEQRDVLIGRYREELEKRDARIVTVMRELADAGDRIGALEGTVASDAEETATLRKRVSELEEAQPAEPAVDESAHVLFLPGRDGYRLIEHEGAAPTPGEAVELEGVRYVVERLGGSPFPGSRLRCAFLSPA